MATFRALIIAALVALGIVFFWLGSAKAQAVCAPDKALQDIIADRFKERLLAHATAAKGKVLVRIYRRDDGRFTIITTQAGSQHSCMVVTGEDFTIMPAGTGL